MGAFLRVAAMRHTMRIARGNTLCVAQKERRAGQRQGGAHCTDETERNEMRRDERQETGGREMRDVVKKGEGEGHAWRTRKERDGERDRRLIPLTEGRG